MATKDDEEMIDAFEGTEPYANDYTFHRWCEHLFILNNEMSKQEIFDAYYLRAYFIVLYELSNEVNNDIKEAYNSLDIDASRVEYLKERNYQV